MLRSAGLVGAGLAAGLVIAGLTTAGASAPAARQPAAVEFAAAAPYQSHEPRRPDKGQKPDRGQQADRGKGHKGFGRPVHGEMTVRKPGGGYQVVAGQRGVVTVLTASSLTVLSEDGFTRTYARDANTRMADGIAVGSAVRVLAIVENGAARAVHVRPMKQKR